MPSENSSVRRYYRASANVNRHETPIFPLAAAVASDSCSRFNWHMVATTSQGKTEQSSVLLTHLPTPAENPDADIVIFDGHCKFCTGQVQRLARWDGKGRRLAFLSLHDPEVAKRFPDLTYDQLMEEMVVVDKRGRRHAGAAAFRYLTTRLPRLYVLAPLMHLPFTLPLWRWGYKQVAKHRYLLMGKTKAADTCDDDACRVHFK
jgi:predicted DCC family thiol-disulfide oxidoreductase YuxK